MQPIQSSSAPRPIGPYSQAIVSNHWIWCSGQVPLDPATGMLVEGDIQAQTRQVMQNLKAVLAAAGATFAQVVKVTVFMTDLKEFPAMNQVYWEYFSNPFPARSTVQVAALPTGARVEIEAVAISGK